ncbi:GNAT family N-acetyltransferase [Streptomyces avicenniae]|uniref:GNAT family N-acetyltransferase n=1 Tax=Streptomyces avicenniae TaxID=500153 RepID=UPI00069AE76D|nr:GNAT family N-acetyltransferase [Streptomyces avicenniae]
MPLLVTPVIAADSIGAQDQPTLPLGDGPVLRPWLPDDAEAVAAAHEDPLIQRWHARRADSVAEAAGWVAGWQADWAAERGLHWAIAEGGTLLGRLSLKDLDLIDGTAEVAYWMTPAARGRGVCPRAVRTLTAWALDEAGFHRLTLLHSTANTASCRVAEKAAFALEGTLRSAALHADGHHDMHLHAHVRGD